MPLEQIVKLQPNRCLALRGFADRGACAAIHSATANSFIVSGVFRDPADFAVAVLWDADNFFEHPTLKYLPDLNFAGMVLEFDLQYAGLQPIDSPKNPTIDWPYLDYIRANGTSGQISLLANAALQSGSHTAASGTFTISAPAANLGDTLWIWFQNYAWEYPAGGGDTAAAVANYLAAQINATSWGTNLYKLSAVASGANLTLTATPAGSDGNMIRLYAVASNPAGLSASPNPLQLAGGSSNVTWRISLDFTALGIDQVRQLWLTFAPQLADSSAYATTNWDATFTNWTISADPDGNSPLKVAGAGSVRVEETDAWTTFAGTGWSSTSVGWFSKGFAMVSNNPGDQVTITYWCQHAHDLWVGTSLYSDRGKFGVTVDGVAQPDLDMMLVSYGATVTGTASGTVISEAISTRRQIASGLAAGQHTVVLTVKTGDAPPTGITEYGYCYFDFLEAVVKADIPAPLGPWTDRSPAIDYDTDHGYKLPPARLLWIFDQLGFQGPMNEYIGVFWWNQRKVINQTLAAVVVTFGSGFVAGDSIFLTIGTLEGSSIVGTTIGKSVEAHESPTIWAAHFAYFINETFSGVWAQASGAVLTIHVRSAAAAYQFTGFSASNGGSAAGTVTWTGDLSSSAAGTWVVDTSQTPALNYGAQCWHADLYAQVKARNNVVATSFSMELVDTPDDPASGQVWVARFADNSQVLTDTGFSNLRSAQCVPSSAAFLSYQQQAYLHAAQLQQAAALTPYLQLGEFLWWFFSRLWRSPLGYVSYTDPISIGLASPHNLTTGQRVKVAGVEGTTAANGIWPCTVTDATHFTIPVAANGAWVAGTGMVSGGSMAYYDAATSAAAMTSLGRALGLFCLPDDNPASVNGGADATFLAGRLQAHVAAIVAYVQGTYPSALFEILFPNDVNGATVTPISGVGGPLNQAVSFPAQWRAQATAPFQIFKLEQLAFLTTDRNLDLVKAGLAYIRSLAWNVANLRYLHPIDNPGIAFDKEYKLAQAAGFPYFIPFAMDHVNLYNWPVAPASPAVQAQILG